MAINSYLHEVVLNSGNQLATVTADPDSNPQKYL